MQEEGLKLADESFGSCKVFRLGLQSSELSGIDMLSSAAEQMYGDTDPSQVFSKEPAFTMEEEHGTRIMVIRLPYAQKDEIRLEKKGEDLVLAVRNETRRFKLPDKVSRRRLTGWDFEGGRLRVRFDYD
jgi:arsenite-transporting ATPase